MNTIVEAEMKARKLKALIFVFGQAMLEDIDGGAYVECLEVIEDMADELYTSLKNMRLDSQSKKAGLK